MQSEYIFVFGSNTEGRHGKGAALTALKQHGAIYGKAEGPQGRSYAIITKELRPWKPKITIQNVAQGVKKFLQHAQEYQEKTFYLTKIGCGLAGHNENEIKALFKNAPANVIKPKEWY